MQQYDYTFFGMRKAKHGTYVEKYDAEENKNDAVLDELFKLQKAEIIGRVYAKVFLDLAAAMQTLSEEDKQKFVMVMHGLDSTKHSYRIERNTEL